VAQWLLADRKGGTVAFQKFDREVATEREGEAGWQECHQKNAKHANTPRI
jgi:hypothetical protein